MRTKTAVVNFRMTVAGKELLAKLAERDGISMSAYLEKTVRAAARRAGFSIPVTEGKTHG